MISLTAALILPACSSGGPSEVAIGPGQYPRAFDATKEALRELSFRVDRIDAASGVITTTLRDSPGFANPFDPVESTVGQEWEDLVNRQYRRVRVTFEPAMPGADTSIGEDRGVKGTPPVDLRASEQPLKARIEVTIERLQRPGWRPNTRTVTASTFTMDTELRDRGLYPSYTVPVSQDPELGGRLAKRITELMARPAPTLPPAENEQKSIASTAPAIPAPQTPPESPNQP